jgi:hypothetical protein
VKSKATGQYVIDRTLYSSHFRGWFKITWDNLHDVVKKSGKSFFRRKGRRPPHVATQSSWERNKKVLDIGGDFSSVEASDDACVRGYGHYKAEDGGAIRTYDGGFVPYSQNQYLGIGNADMSGLGSTGKFSGEFGRSTTAEGVSAWKRFKPKLFVADMGQFVGEIRETLPMLQTSASMFSRQFLDAFGFSVRHQKRMTKEMSNHWLNLQFGWSPFVSDLTKFLKKFGDLDKRLQQCKRDNGKDIRRHGLLSSTMEGTPKEVQTLSTDGLGQSPYIMFVAPFTFSNSLLANPYHLGDFRSTITYTERYQQWFSACFRYWVPTFDSNSAIDTVHNYLRMFGIRVTPSLVWNLTPWSWLADWVGNVGDNIDAYTDSADHLTAKYAYIMKTSVVEVRNDSAVKCGGVQIPGLSWRRGCVAKTRMQASQFGFAIASPDFTAWQWSILASLGLPQLHVESKRR